MFTLAKGYNDVPLELEVCRQQKHWMKTEHLHGGLEEEMPRLHNASFHRGKSRARSQTCSTLCRKAH